MPNARGAMSIAQPPMGALPVAALVAMLAPALAVAAPDSRHKPQPAAGCTRETVASGTVATVIDGRTFALEDGREVRLPAIEIPPPPDPGPAPAAAPATTDSPPPQPLESDPNQAAADALKSLLA